MAGSGEDLCLLQVVIYHGKVPWLNSTGIYNASQTQFTVDARLQLQPSQKFSLLGVQASKVLSEIQLQGPSLETRGADASLSRQGTYLN